MMTYVKHTGILLLLMIGAAIAAPAMAAPAIQATLYKNPNCHCCRRYADYLDQHGFDVKLVDTNKLPQIQRAHGVPSDLEGCHVMLVDGYVVDGLVPVDVVQRMLRERPAITGITLPGMPMGAPGMDGPGMQKQGPLVVYAFGHGKPSVYATE